MNVVTDILMFLTLEHSKHNDLKFDLFKLDHFKFFIFVCLAKSTNYIQNISPIF